SAATAASRNPDDILISMAGPGLVFDDDAEYQSLLVDRAAKRELSVDDYVAFLDERNVPHGSPKRAHEAIQRMAELGVGRYYVQEFSSLEDVDLTRMELIFSALQGSA
ncbi:MAG: hypothetical protein QGM48_10640, partial [Actinomycetota bacterium]|nr:hypothetical protein [Actinomycetota bacterium]